MGIDIERITYNETKAALLRYRIELVKQQLADRILLKARPCAEANLTVELHSLQQELRHLH
jgi:hypothetical protein